MLLLACMLSAMWWFKRSTSEAIQEVSAQVAEVQKGQTIKAAAIRVRLEEASERARDEELKAAEREPRFDDARIAVRAGKQVHEVRISRIKDLAASFVELEERENSSPVLVEMTRILNEEKTDAVDKAIAYAERQRVGLLEGVGAGSMPNRNGIGRTSFRS